MQLHPGTDRQLTGEDSRVAVYEVDDPKIARELGERGVHLVETFAIAEMIAALK